MSRLATKFKNVEVVIKEFSSEQAWIGTIKRLYKEADQLFYEIDCDGDLISVSASSVAWIKPRKAIKLAEVKSINCAPLRIISGFN